MPEAEDFRTLIDAVDGRPAAMINLASSFFLPRGEEALARDLCERALALAPEDPEVRARAQAVRSAGIGSWYFSMVQDSERHRLYAEAFAATIRPGSIVLDIGAGTGLFAMMAARAGAGLVVAYERNPAVAAVARRSVARNGLSDRVKIVTGDALDAEVGEDLPRHADVLIWDNLANNLLGAGGVATVEHALRRLLVPDAPVIPARAEVRVALAHYRKPADRTMSVVEGFDLSAFNDLQEGALTAGTASAPRVSSAATIFDVDFTGVPIRAARTSVTVTADSGTVDGVVQWIRFHLADGITYETDAESVKAFGRQFHPVEPFEAAGGEAVVIEGAHDRVNTWFWVRR
jgi:SAM-dependent methyltransferase